MEIKYTVVREIFAYRNFHVLIFRVKKFSDIVYLSEKLTQNLNMSSLLVIVMVSDRKGREAWKSSKNPAVF